MTKERINHMYDGLDAEFVSFLEPQKYSTKHSYSNYFKLWVQFSKMNGKESIEFKKKDKDGQTEKLVVGFHQWMLQEKKLSENTAKTACGSIRGFFSSKRLPLVFIQAEKRHLGEAQVKNEDYLFDKSDLYKMSEQGNLTEKYIVLVGKSVGLRASDFLTFTYGQFRSLKLDSDAPIAIGKINTMKEKVPAYPFLDSDAVAIVKLILERGKEKKDTDRILEFKDEQPLGLALKRMFEAAHLVSGGKTVRFHNLRKYLIDRLSAIASESQWKQIVGKTINEGAYVSQDQLREVYARAMPNLLVNGNNKNHVQLEKLETALIETQKQLANQELINQELRKEIATSNAENRAYVEQYVKEHLTNFELLVKKEREKREKK